MSALISHVDVRVRNAANATEFYGALLGALGAVRQDAGEWNAWQLVPEQWFGITEDEQAIAGTTRIAFTAPSRGVVDTIATLLPIIGGRDIEAPHEAYGPNYYAVFFSDPEGNRLEVVHFTPPES